MSFHYLSHLAELGPADIHPFCSNSFDLIYTKPVLGFQDECRAESMLAEIFRTLKPGGLCVANEAI